MSHWLISLPNLQSRTRPDKFLSLFQVFDVLFSALCMIAVITYHSPFGALTHAAIVMWFIAMFISPVANNATDAKNMIFAILLSGLVCFVSWVVYLYDNRNNRSGLKSSYDGRKRNNDGNNSLNNGNNSLNNGIKILNNENHEYNRSHDIYGSSSSSSESEEDSGCSDDEIGKNSKSSFFSRITRIADKDRGYRHVETSDDNIENIGDGREGRESRESIRDRDNRGNRDSIRESRDSNSDSNSDTNRDSNRDGSRDSSREGNRDNRGRDNSEIELSHRNTENEENTEMETESDSPKRRSETHGNRNKQKKSYYTPIRKMRPTITGPLSAVRCPLSKFFTHCYYLSIKYFLPLKSMCPD